MCGIEFKQILVLLVRVCKHISRGSDKRLGMFMFSAKWRPIRARECLVGGELDGEEACEVVEASLAYAVHDHARRRAVQRAQAAHVHDRATRAVLHALHHYLRAAHSKSFTQVLSANMDLAFVPESHSLSTSGFRRSVYKQYMLYVT